MQFATNVSITDTQEVSAAKPIIRKNAIAAGRPNTPMELKTLGNEIKIRLDDHHSRKECNTCIKKLDLIGRLV